jgi:Arc/MetJ-type ribon-helix-helix transcriptional regulator
MKQESESGTVNLPPELYKRIKDRATATDFESVDEYVVFVLSEVLKEEGENEKLAVDNEQEKEIKKRLKELGYLD